MSERPHFFAFLTQEEWRLAFALVFVEQFEEYQGHYPLASYATPGMEDMGLNEEEAMRRAVRFLHFEHRMEFHGLQKIDRSGSIVGYPVCPANLAYRDVLLIAGKTPNMHLCLEGAIRTARERCPSLDTTPLEEALFESRRAAKSLEENPDPVGLDASRQFLDDALATLGIVRIPNAKETIH